MNMDLEILFKEAEHEILSRGLKSPETRLNGLKHVKDFMRDMQLEVYSLLSISKVKFIKEFATYKGGKLNGAERSCVNLLFQMCEISCNNQKNTEQERMLMQLSKKTEEIELTNTHVGNKACMEKLFRGLMWADNFKMVDEISKDDIPTTTGFYAIRVRDVNELPKIFAQKLIEREHNILYIGISECNLRKRLWNEELHLKKPATFFRSLGAMLGYTPEYGSLRGSESRNYKFSERDITEIINWMKKHLLVNYISWKENLKEIEKQLIRDYKPIINIQNNPYKLDELEELRKKCIDIAHGK